MKLYAKIKNEKGRQEGMGGNERLDIDIMVGNYQLAALEVKKVNSLGRIGYALIQEQTELAFVEDRKEICNWNACKNKAERFGVCKKHLPLEE